MELPGLLLSELLHVENLRQLGNPLRLRPKVRPTLNNNATLGETL